MSVSTSHRGGESGRAWRYVQLADRIRGQITAGNLGPQEQLPGEYAMAAEHGVSLSTVRRAFEILEDEGLVVAVPGRGRFVGQAPLLCAERVARALLADIAAGRLSARVLPNERALAAHYEVSPSTVRDAAHRLHDLGVLIIVGGGHSTIIKASPQECARLHGTLSDKKMLWHQEKRASCADLRRRLAEQKKRADGLEKALNNRVVIALATGMVSGRTQAPAPTVSEAMRRYARTARRHLHDIARAIVDD